MSKILTIVSSPGPAESLGQVVKKMRDLGQDIELIDTSDTADGLIKIFEKIGVEYKKAGDLGNIENYFNISKDFADKIIDLVKPDKILTGTYRDTAGVKLTIEDMIIFCGRNRNIPVFQYVDMWDNWFPKKGLDLIPDIFLVQDEIAKEIIKERGNVPDNKITIVGNPGLEQFLQDKIKNKKFKKNDFGFENKRVIAYFDQCHPVRNDISFPWAVNCLKDKDILIFSRHPRDERDFRQYFKNQNVVDAEKLKISSDDILDFCDICITQTSTMSLKAALLETKTINIILDNDFVLNGKYPLVLIGGSQQATSEKELDEVIGKEFIASDDFKQVIKEFENGNGLNKIIELLKL